MVYDVLRPGHVLMPYFRLRNEEGIIIFSTLDQTNNGSSMPRTPGRYTSTAWIPGNFLSEGTVYVTATMRTKDRRYRPFWASDAVAFNVIDTMEGGSVRGEWAGRLTGAVRPLLDWSTEYDVADAKVVD
jgi:lipopolysaccharide transport system ATP-binding protein